MTHLHCSPSTVVSVDDITDLNCKVLPGIMCMQFIWVLSTSGGFSTLGAVLDTLRHIESTLEGVQYTGGLS